MVDRDTTTEVALDEWMAIPANVRFQLYAGIALNLLADPANVSDGDIATLSYGIFRDAEMESAVATAMAQESAQQELIGAMPGYEEGDSTSDLSELLRFDILSTSLVERHGDTDAVEILGSFDTTEPERLQVAATTLGLIPALAGGAAVAGGLGVGTGGLSGLNGAALALRTALSTQSLRQGIVTVAARVGGVLPSSLMSNLRTWGRWALRGVAGVGGAVTAGALANAWLNPEQYGDQALQEMDAGVIRIAELAQDSDPQFWQAASKAATSYASGSVPFSPLSTQAELAREGLTVDPQGTPGRITAGGQRTPGGIPSDMAERYPGYLPGEPPSVVDPDVDPDNPFIGGYSESYEVVRPDASTGLRDKALQRSVQTGNDDDAYWTTARPTYRLSDFERLWGSFTPSQVIQVQSQMIDAGLLDAGKFSPGTRDLATMNAFQNILSISNGEGMKWEDTLLKMAIQGRLDAEDTNRPAFQRRAYLEPDMAALEETAMSAVEQRLGRQINDWERSLLVGTMAQANRAAFEAEEQAQYQQYLAEGRALELEEAGTPVEQTDPGTVQGVNPEARFEQQFRDLFGKELDRRDETQRVSQLTSSLMTGLSRGFGAME